MLDAFLQLYENDVLVEGETLDTDFPGAMEIDSITLGAPATDSGDDDEVTVKGSLRLDAKKGTKEQVAAVEKAMRREGARLEERLKTRQTQLAEKARKGKKSESKDSLTLQITKDADFATPSMLLAYCKSKSLKAPQAAEDKTLGNYTKAVLTVRKLFGIGAQPYLILTFTKVEMSGYSMSYQDGEDRLTETVTFRFSTYEVEYYPQLKTGERGSRVFSSGQISGNVSTAGR